MKNLFLRAIISIVIVLAFTLGISAQAIPSEQSSFEENEVTYSNGAVSLAGSILVPRGNGPFPAVVIIHGSGSSDRSNAWTTAYAKSLAKRGIVVLYPDKRGSGKSTGTWFNASFEELADDAIAGVELLSISPKIDPKKIGVIGFSQGGHIVPVTAARSSNVAFAISVSGSTVPMIEQIMDEVEIGAELTGLTPKQIEIVNDINRKGINYALTGEGADDYLSALNSAKNGELKDSPVVQKFPTEPNPGMIQFLRVIKDFDPIAYWKKVSVKALFVYGGKDRNVRTQKSIARLEKTFGKGAFDYTVMLFSQSDHGIYREDLIDFITSWITLKDMQLESK